MLLDNDAFVSIPELNKVLESSKDTVWEEVNIFFQNPVDRFDIAFIGGLFLLHKTEGKRFILSGDNTAGVYGESHHTAELMQYLAQIQELYGSKKVGGEDWIRIQKSNPNRTYLSPSDLSKDEVNLLYTPKFAPIFYIDSTTLQEFFSNRKGSRMSVLKKKYVDILQTQKKTNVGVRNKYYETYANNQILKFFKGEPPIYAFVYCLVHTIANPFQSSRDLDEVKGYIESLIAFTKRYVAGIYELAKNIVEHIDEGKGIITVGSYAIDKDPGRNVEAFVFDYGSTGIVQTMKAELTAEIEAIKADCKPVPVDFKEDLKILEDQFELKDFLEPGPSKRLFRQIRREMAHLGLMHFVSLIRSNEGNCHISSLKNDGSRDSYPILHNQKDDVAAKVLRGKSIDFGTNYYFSLPVSRGKELQGGQVIADDIRVTKEVAAAMSEIFRIKGEIKCIRVRNKYSDYEEGKDEKEKIISSREDEYELESIIKEEMGDGAWTDDGIRYCAIDFAGVDMSSNSMLRVFAMLSEMTEKGIVVFNVDADKFIDMITNNALYFESFRNDYQRVPYWVKDRAILVYSKQKNEGFYFADMLFGDSEESFQRVNRTINKTFPNCCTIMSNPRQMSPNFPSASAANTFFRQSTLLPFDLVIENMDGEPLFFTNLRTLINKPLSK